MCQTAWMMSAPSTASGKDANSGVRNSTVTIVTAHVTRLATWVRAPAPSLTADDDMPPPAIIPPKQRTCHVDHRVGVELLIGVYLVAVLVGELVRYADALTERHQQDADCGQHHRE